MRLLKGAGLHKQAATSSRPSIENLMREILTEVMQNAMKPKLSSALAAVSFQNSFFDCKI